MRILVDARHLSNGQPTGVGEYTIQLLRALFRLDRENEYVLLTCGTRRHDIGTLFPEQRQPLRPSTGSGDTAAEVEGPHVSFLHVRVPNKLLNAAIACTGRPTLDRLAGGRVDLLWLPNLNFVPGNTTIPTVLTIHDLSWKYFPRFYSRKMRAWHKAVRPDQLIANAARIIVPSQSTRDDLVRSFQKPSDLVEVIPHGIDSAFQPRLEPRDHSVRSRLKLPKRYALFVGTLEPRKNVHAILDAMEAYRERTRDDLHLVLAGSWGWNARDLRRRIGRVGHTRSPRWVHDLGYVPAEDRPALYRHAAVFVWPSVYEGFGLPVLEAMACGTPVITSHTSSMPEVTGSAAILVDPFDHRDITAALEQLLGSEKLVMRLRLAGAERSKKFSWDEAAKKTLETFHSCRPRH